MRGAAAEWEHCATASSRDSPLGVERSLEYGADIIRACETGEPFRFNGNVPNRTTGGLLIDNLPADCCVEVPCVASAGASSRSPSARCRATSPR